MKNTKQINNSDIYYVLSSVAMISNSSCSGAGVVEVDIGSSDKAYTLYSGTNPNLGANVDNLLYTPTIPGRPEGSRLNMSVISGEN